MQKIILIIFILFYTSFCISQNKNINIQINNESISIVKYKPFNSIIFNENLKKELKIEHISIYNMEDIINGNFVINTKYFNKPLSKYATESYNNNNNIFFKSLIPKPIDYNDFKYLNR